MAKADILHNLKFSRIVRDLNISRASVLGHMELLWLKCYVSKQYVFDDPFDTESWAEWDGVPGTFAEALEKRGFLDRHDDGRVAIHDFFDHAPRFVLRHFNRHTQEGCPVGVQRAPTGRPPASKETNGKETKCDEKERNVVSCAEPPDKPVASTPPKVENPTVLLHFSCSGTPPHYLLHEAKTLEYEALYSPQINVRFELAKARQWLEDNPARRKTARGMPKFLNGWLSRAVDNGSGKSTPQRQGKNLAAQPKRGCHHDPFA